MAIRTTAAEVRAIIDIDSTITDLTPFITAASAVVDAQCSSLDDATAAIVETWLSAHFVTIRDNRVSSETAGPTAQNYQYKLGLGLDCSMYGQTAMQLDSSGGLAAWNENVKSGKTAKPNIYWLGTDPCEVTSS